MMQNYKHYCIFVKLMIQYSWIWDFLIKYSVIRRIVASPIAITGVTECRVVAPPAAVAI